MSRIEQLISEIEEYIDSCKPKAFSSTDIIVNKEEIEELLMELRMRIPDEIKKYQKIISNQDAILSDARTQADSMLNVARTQADSMLENAKAQTDDLINEHEIMQMAYAQADEVVEQAQADAQMIIDNAYAEAESVRGAAVRYTDDMLGTLQKIISHAIEESQSRYNSYVAALQSSFDIVSSNREELSGASVTEAAGEAMEAPAEGPIG